MSGRGKITDSCSDFQKVFFFYVVFQQALFSKAHVTASPPPRRLGARAGRAGVDVATSRQKVGISCWAAAT